MAQGCESGEGRVQSGQVVGQEGRRLDGLAVAVPVQGKESARGLGQRVVSQLLALGAELSVTADRDVHERRIAFAEVLVAEFPGVEGAGPEVFHEDIAAPGEASNRNAGLVVVQVEGQAALVAVDCGVHE